MSALPTEDRVSRLEASYEHLATKADLYQLKAELYQMESRLKPAGL